MTNDQAFAQGARCGHIEGKGRAGLYVIGEEELLADEAAGNQSGLAPLVATSWASGYRVGYRLAAEGSELPAEYAPEPAQDFGAALAKFLEQAQALIDEHRTRNFPTITREVLKPEMGKRYVRVWKNSEQGFKEHGDRGCCYCFVDTTNGDILKPASWKGPAKGARGNIYRADAVQGVTPYGAARAR